MLRSKVLGPWASLLMGLFLSGLWSSAAPLYAGENADLLLRGAALAEARACRACHLIGGTGALVGPALDQVTLRRPQEWLRRWLNDPAGMKPGTLMPAYDWSDEEFQAIFAFLSQFQTPVDGASILGREKCAGCAGKALIEAYQCRSCHQVAGQSGRPVYPVLDSVKERRTEDWVKRWLRDPQAVKPGNFMPTFPFTDAEIDALVEYLYQ